MGFASNLLENDEFMKDWTIMNDDLLREYSCNLRGLVPEMEDRDGQVQPIKKEVEGVVPGANISSILRKFTA